MPNRPSAKRGILIFILGVVVGFVLCIAVPRVTLYALMPSREEEARPEEARILEGVVGMAEREAAALVCSRIVDHICKLVRVEQDPNALYVKGSGANCYYEIPYYGGQFVLSLDKRGGVVTKARVDRRD